MSLVAEGVGFAYPRRSPVLDGVDLSIGAGERVALSAPSGTGKTTLCRLLAGYLPLDAGRVLVDGTEFARAGSGACLWRPGSPRPVQLIWQHPEQAFDPRLPLWRSLAEATGSRVRADRRAVMEAIGETGLLERLGARISWVDKLPHELSGGELMRLAIVRALLVGPRYLICDEMTAMLDALTQATLWREVLSLSEERGMGLLVVSHAPDLVRRVATRVVELG